MPTCPECTGKMEFNPNIRKYVCQACGLALTKREVEDDWDEQRYKESAEDRRERERKEYKDWYFDRNHK